MSAGKVVFSREGAVATILFDNPDKRNALSFDMWRELRRICHDIAGDRTLRVVVLRGAGDKAFVAGTEIDDFLAFESGERGLQYEAEIDSYVGAVESLPFVTIAAVRGFAIGGGLALACACDIRIATPDSRFGAPIGRTIGNSLSAQGYARLAASVGVAQAKRVLLLGELLSASELAALGALYRVVEPEHFDATLAAVVARAAENAPLTTWASKTALFRLTYANIPDIDDLTERVYGSADFRMGVRNFLEKKERSWTGE